MRTLLSVLFALGTFTAISAAAQDAGPTCRRTPGPQPVLVCDEIVVNARRNQSFLLLPRSSVHFEPPPLERDLAREVARTVRHAPF